MVIAHHAAWINYVVFPGITLFIVIGGLWLIGMRIKEHGMARTAPTGSRLKSALPSILVLAVSSAVSLPVAIATYHRMRP
jgi:hypothetical protein